MVISQLRVMALALVILVSWTALAPGLRTARAQQPASDRAAQPDSGEQAKRQPVGASIAQGEPGAGEPSEAEQVAALQATISADQDHLEQLEAKLEEHGAELDKASEEFRKLDQTIEAELQKIESLHEEGKTEEAAELERTIQGRQLQRDLAKERLEAAVQLRKATSQQITTLREKIAANQQRLERILGTDETPAADQNGQNGAPATPIPSEVPPPRASSSPVNGLREGQPATEAPPVAGAAPVQDGGESPVEEVAEPAPLVEEMTDEAIVEARQEVVVTETAAQAAQLEFQEIEQRLQTLDSSIRLEQDAREAARKQAGNATQTLEVLGQELEEKIAEGAGREVLTDLQSRILETQSRLDRARQEVQLRADELDRLQDERSDLLSARIAALQKVQMERVKAEAARATLESLRDPFSPRNIARWLATEGPPILAILLGMWIVRWFLRVGTRRLSRIFAASGTAEDPEEREQRADMLVRVFYKFGTILVVIGGLLLILSEIGVDIAPLWTLISALFAMIAIGFVAVWSVVSNALCALILLIFQPFKIGSSVQLVGTEIRGKVIDFNLIYTTLRGEAGDLIEVPNNMFFQQAIRHRERGTCFGLEETFASDADKGKAPSDV